MNRCLSCSRAPVFGLLADGSAVPRPTPTILAVFDTKHFSFDSCKENLPKKRIHQNYTLIAVRRGRVFDGASARNDRLRHGSSGSSSFSMKRVACLKRTACHARTATPPQGRWGVDRARVFSRCKRSISIWSSPMNNPREQWSPYWWQTVTAVPPFSMSFETSSAYAQPSDGSSSQGRSTWPPPAANTGILGQLGQPANGSSGYPPAKPTSLLGQFLTGAGMAPAIPNGLQAETEAGVGNYPTPAASRSTNRAHCLDHYVHCHDLHSFGQLINGKRCQDCFNMCLLDGTWPDWYCPLRPF